MDFYRIKHRVTKTGIEIYPDFKVTRSKDLMIRGKSFYAIWDEEVGLWSTDEYDVQRLIDHELFKQSEEIRESTGATPAVRYLGDFSSNSWRDFRSYVGLLSDSSVQLDENLTFQNTEVRKSDYVSRRLPYSLEAGDISAWDELVGVLYDPDERAKIEWSIGAIISGDAKTIQKFVVFYGAAGTGKSTILDIIQNLFEGYYTTFEAKAIGSNNNTFAVEAFKSNPLVAIQHDGDLSKIEDNSKLNSIVSHEDMMFNEKFKPSYTSRVNAFLYMGTNKPVKITDAKSGLIRRLIDINPSGNKVSPRRYQVLKSQIGFELGAIAHHCLEVYRSMGKDYYSGYVPEEMMLQTDVFFNFIEENYHIFKEQDGVSLQQAWLMYQNYISESGVEYKLPKHKLREELRNYFDEFIDRVTIDGLQVRSWYAGFKTNRFQTKLAEEPVYALSLHETHSVLDKDLANCPAQYATENETPKQKWANVTTNLSDIDTSQVHYVKVPENHIVIDFDLKGPDGQKSAELNLAAASLWPPTYAEYSKGGGGIHLHYIYEGDVTKLSSEYGDGIEIKVFTGGSSLRRRLSQCNNVPVATFTGVLPIKEKKSMLSGDSIKSEKGLRSMIERNLRKEIHPGTKPSMDFIHHILDEAYKSGLAYDVSDMRSRILAFAASSSNQALTCIRIANSLKYVSEKEATQVQETEKAREVYFDCEVYPNLFVICWKFEGSDTIVKMINPTPIEVEDLFKLRLVGYNCRRYDNHILYARAMGYSNEALYQLSQKIIGNDRNAYFGAAYGLSYVDIYEYASKKQSLKKWEIELGIHHMESEIPWDEPVAEEDIPKVVEYCCNDVLATEETRKATNSDFVARQILSALSGLPMNDTTQKHTARIIFGNDRKAQEQFVYTDLSEEFPGYKFERGKSTYLGETVGEGGLVRAVPGIYTNVALLDVESMHPSSIENLNMFGEYTKNYSAIKEARLAIKHGDYDTARSMMGGKLAPYLDNPEKAEKLSYALKIAINIVYGMTSASFDNPFRDKRNKDNIAAKRGALFMMDLKKFVEDRGFIAAHIKTDSIKIPEATPEIIQEVMEFGSKYGYTFEHEATYERFCLVNDAVYIAYQGETKKRPAHWTATGAQFKHPYVFKTLFSKEEVMFDDLCETKQVTKGAIYLDFASVKPMATAEENAKPHFVGRIGRFVPVLEDTGGGRLINLRPVGEPGEEEIKEYAIAGSTGYLWKEAEVVRGLSQEDTIDYSYHDALAQEAIDTIGKFGMFDEFVNVEEPLDPTLAFVA